MRQSGASWIIETETVLSATIGASVIGTEGASWRAVHEIGGTLLRLLRLHLILAHAEFTPEEAEAVHREINALAQRHAAAVSGTRLHANQHRRPGVGLHRLHLGSVLKAVRRKHAIIMVCRHDQRGRVAGAVAQIVQRRILVNRAKILLLIAW